MILLLNSITEMRGRVVGEGLQERPTDARVVFRLWDRGGGSGREGKRETRHGGLQQPLGWLDGWMDGWINDYSIAIVDAYIASIAIRIMSDTRDEKKDRNKDQRCQGVLQDTQDPRTNCKMYDTGNILNSIIYNTSIISVYSNMHT